MTFHLDKHTEVYDPHDTSTHRIHYIESIMTPDGKVYYLTLGAHLDNALYICLGGTTWDFFGGDRLSYKSIPEEYHTADEYDLCDEFGIISLHDKDFIIAPHVTKAQAVALAHMYDNGHITLDTYKQARSTYLRQIRIRKSLARKKGAQQ